MRKFLSIDWDYFLVADREEREYYFPNAAVESMSDCVKDFMWDEKYKNHEELKYFSVRENDYNIFKHICKEYRGRSFLIAESHKEIYNYIMSRTSVDEEFEIYNIDFHHDLYGSSNDINVTCGNWVIKLKQMRNFKYHWVSHSDSDKENIKNNIDIVLNDLGELFSFNPKGQFESAFEFDYLFICRSDMWSPPHLDPKFRTAINLLLNSHTEYFVKNILPNRKIIQIGGKVGE